MKYFTEEEIQDFKDDSINYPYVVVEKEQHEVIEVSEVVVLSGMANNNGTPTEIGITLFKVAVVCFLVGVFVGWLIFK